MTHDEAMKDGATERYVLDDMTDEERDAFEEHYFDCAVCAEDVKAAIAIRDEGLAAVRDLPEPVVVPFPQPRRRLATPLAAAASAVLVALSMYAGVVQPAMRELHAARTPFVADGEANLRTSRGAGASTAIDGHKNTKLVVEVDTEDKSPRFTFNFLDAAGRERFAIPVSGDRVRAGDVEVSLRSETLESGVYTLRVDGTEAGVVTYRLIVR